MTLQEEMAFLAKFAKAAGAGELLNIGELKSAYEKEIGHPTSNSTVYDLLARHEWRKLMSRPFHKNMFGLGIGLQMVAAEFTSK
jgi:hypothetical protein